jgi:hypothetical protein
MLLIMTPPFSLAHWKKEDTSFSDASQKRAGLSALLRSVAKRRVFFSRLSPFTMNQG